ncbi:MAG: hypothetical protein HKN43_12195 [Rhodothermales bacterium]|nr:hypothetical protein [Rhodothermales bacterium]
MRELRELDLPELRDDLELLADEPDLRDEDVVARDELLLPLLDRVDAPDDVRDEPLEERVLVPLDDLVLEPDELRVVVPRVEDPLDERVRVPLEDLVLDPDELRVVVPDDDRDDPLDDRVDDPLEDPVEPDELRVVVPRVDDPRVVDERVASEDDPRVYPSVLRVLSVLPRYVDLPSVPSVLDPPERVTPSAEPVVERPVLVDVPDPADELPPRTTVREEGYTTSPDPAVAELPPRPEPRTVAPRVIPPRPIDDPRGSYVPRRAIRRSGW